MKVLLSLLVSMSVYADSLRALASLGYNAHPDVVRVIEKKAIKYGIKPDLMIAIAVVESGLNPQAKRVNNNGTVDQGLFQINTVNKDFCKEFDIKTVKGNTECAAKLLAKHKVNKPIDSLWYCRYHSKTPSKKVAYCSKLNEIRSKYQWEMKTLSLVQANM